MHFLWTATLPIACFSQGAYLPLAANALSACQAEACAQGIPQELFLAIVNDTKAISAVR